uniref:Uncharacterized protein n=1 Tax=Oryza glumipatula TaxID=40148 RepID=A0A0E0BRX5_9ORYZ
MATVVAPSLPATRSRRQQPAVREVDGGTTVVASEPSRLGETLAKRRYLGSALRRVTVFRAVIVAAPVQHWARLLPRTPYNIDRGSSPIISVTTIQTPGNCLPKPGGESAADHRASAT